MRGRKTATGLAVIAVGGAIVLGGCGGSSGSTTETRNAGAPAGTAMKGHHDAMHGGKEEKGSHQAMDQHHEAMHEG